MAFAGHSTYSVSDLTSELREFLAESFDGIWVVGEVQRFRKSRPGHLYFELIEKGDADRIVGKIDAALWARDAYRVQRILAATQQELRDGVQIRCRGSLDFYPPAGRLQLVVREIDPAFSLGHLELRRRQTLAWLEQRGLVDRNRQLPFPKLPLRVGLITSDGSAAFHDFVTTLADSPYRFEVVLAHASMQGDRSETEVVTSITKLGRISGSLDLIVIVRGGGSRTDLAAFDSRRIAAAIAESGLPIVTGLGHEIDESIADLVSHTACKTPTRAGELLVEAIQEAEASLMNYQRKLMLAARTELERASLKLERFSGLSRAFSLGLRAGRHRLDELSHRIVSAASLQISSAQHQQTNLSSRLTSSSSFCLRQARRSCKDSSERLRSAAQARLRRVSKRIEELDRTVRQLQPERVLRLGFSMTRHADGRLVRSADRIKPGDRIHTQLADGELHSRVEPK